jgi:hypothetical protein
MFHCSTVEIGGRGFDPQLFGAGALMRIVFIAIGKKNPDRLNGLSQAAQWMATTRAEHGNRVESWACSID